MAVEGPFMLISEEYVGNDIMNGEPQAKTIRGKYVRSDQSWEADNANNILHKFPGESKNLLLTKCYVNFKSLTSANC